MESEDADVKISVIENRTKKTAPAKIDLQALRLIHFRVASSE